MSIRIAYLPSPFVYQTMEAIEEARQNRWPDEQPHRHDYFTLIAVVEAGQGGIHQIDFSDYPLEPDTLYFIAPEQIHHLAPAGPVRGHVVMFTNDFLIRHSLPPEQLTGLELFFNCDEARPIKITQADMAELLFYFKKISAEYSSTEKDRLEALGAWLKLLLLACRRLKIARYGHNTLRDTRQSAIVRHFKNDVEQNFMRWHQVGNYAEAQHLTPSYLNDIIKAETGTSAKDFIQNRIALEAKRLARYSELSAKETAFALGYEDVAHFSKFFKKCTGFTFLEFRQNHPYLL